MAEHGTVRHGDIVRHTICDLEGVVDAITVWANGCERITIQSKETKDGAPAEPFTADIEYIEVLTPKNASPTPPVVQAPAGQAGGSRPTPRRAPDPRR